MSDNRGRVGDQQIMHFFGVRTEGSSSLKLFPRWAEVLGLGAARLVGMDLPLDAPPARYRAAVRRLKDDPTVAGALVTSHKLNVVRAAGDLFDGFTEEARLCREVSAIYKRGGTLWGHACDPTNCGLTLDHFLGPRYWQRHPDAAILSLGAGGATVAMVVHLLTQAQDRPRTVRLVDIKTEKLDHLQTIIDRFPESGIAFDLIHNADAVINDRLLAELPPYSLAINATGLGKDLPGSPLTDAAVFPLGGAVWELNYRGERLFLQQAQRQAAARRLVVEDGWRYFLHGWSSVISYVFDIALTPERFDRFAAVSEAIR